MTRGCLSVAVHRIMRLRKLDSEAMLKVKVKMGKAKREREVRVKKRRKRRRKVMGW